MRGLTGRTEHGTDGIPGVACGVCFLDCSLQFVFSVLHSSESSANSAQMTIVSLPRIASHPYALDIRIVLLSAKNVIKSFRHTGLETFFTTGKKSGVRPDHPKKLQRQFAVLDNARSIQELPSSWKPHLLSGTAGGG